MTNTTVEEDYLSPEFVDVDVRFSITFLPSELVPHLTEVSKVCSDSDIVPLSQFVQLRATPGRSGSSASVEVLAYNGVLSVVKTLDNLRVLQQGSVLVPPKKLLNILKLAGESETRIDATSSELKVRAGSALWTLGIDSNESIPMPEWEEEVVWETIPAQKLSNIMGTVLPAVAKTTARPALSQLSVQDGHLVACDGARVHRRSLEGYINADSSIPRGTADFIRSVFEREDGDVEFASTSHKIAVRSGGVSVQSQRMLTPFPDVSKLILRPALENQDTLRVTASDLRTAIKRVRVNADPDSSAIWLNVFKDRSQHWKLRVKSKNGVGATASDEIRAEWDGKARSVDVCVNHEYLLDAVKLYEDDDYVFIRLGEDTKTDRHALFIEDSSNGFTASISQMSL